MNAAQLCSRLTRKSRSNFYYAFLFLPRPRRDALYAVYAFCRMVDDAVDLQTDPDAQRSELARWRAELARCYDGGAVETPIGRRLAEAVHVYAIPRSALEAILEGVEMDVDHQAYDTFDALYPYCYRVAAAVGLCCIEIFGYTEPRAREYAVNLGVALQLTNIMRDVEGDAVAGRVYIPRDDLARFGVSAADLRAGRYTEGFVALMEHQAARARRFYAAAHETFPLRDARTLVAAEIMGRIYLSLLEELEARRFRVFGGRVTVPTRRKLAIAFRTWAGAHLTRAA